MDIDSHDDKARRDTLLKVAAILCERQPDSPQGYRLRRHALWQAITSVPRAESDGRTPLAAVPADMTADYQARLNNADLALWQQVEKKPAAGPVLARWSLPFSAGRTAAGLHQRGRSHPG